MKKNIIKARGYLKIVIISLFFVGCSDDFLDTSPSTQISTVDAFATTSTTGAILNGIMRDWRSFGFYGMSYSGLHCVCICRDVMGPDVLVLKSHWNQEVAYATFSDETNIRVASNWRMFYKAINNVNNVLANVDAAVGTQAQKDKIRGDALAIRAYSYFELVNTYAPTYRLGGTKKGVPLYLEPTAATTTGNPRATVAEVYTQILADLTAAKALLTTARSSKTYININVVEGFLARVHMMMGNYAAAATSANAAKVGYPLMSQANWANGFRDITNVEWIWGQQNSSSENPDWGSAVGQFDLVNGGGEASLHMSNALYTLYSATDIRRSVVYDRSGKWGTYKFLGASPVYSSHYPYMRAAEMYLIEAEALARTGGAGTATAQTLLFSVQQARDAAKVASGNTGAALINEIITEKRKEFWGEGIYFLDMLRTGIPLTRDPLHNTILNYPADSWNFIFQIPLPEFLINTALDKTTDQNPKTGPITK